jgi:hypothetical protein
MMLSTALSMMIDKAECLFFLNTPNSIQATEAIDRTKSPWIYHEISISSLIRKRRLSEYRREVTKGLFRWVDALMRAPWQTMIFVLGIFRT